MTALKVHGTDLSHHNPTPDFALAKKNGLQWCIHKATEGSTFTDRTYAERRLAAARAGLLFGAYGFARPDTDGKDAKLEALHLMKVARPKAGDIVPALDFEVEFSGAETWCRTYMGELGRLLRAKGLAVPGMGLHYGPDDFGNDYRHYRWVPRYNNTNTPPTVPWDIFQFSNGVLGDPKSFPGLGNVDLNTMRAGFKMDPLILRPIYKAPTDKLMVTLGHASLQYSDTLKQQEHDCEIIFSRARARNLMALTGTEAGESGLWGAVKAAADKYNYRVHRNASNWVAVNKDVIKKGTWKVGDVYVADRDDKNNPIIGAGHDPAFPWVEFEHKVEGVGTFALAGVHYPTMGRNERDPNYWANELYARAIGKWAHEHGAGARLVIVGGDYNMSDKRSDLFFDQPLTTLADELQKWPGTGHGDIDGIATYDADNRVQAMSWNAYGDKVMNLFTDHYYTEGQIEVTLMKAA